jgi:hypothetical protein
MNNIGSLIKGNLTLEAGSNTTDVGDGSLILQSKLTFVDPNSNNTVSIAPNNINTSYSLTLPGAFPAASQNILIADATGNLVWETSVASSGGGGSFSQIYNGSTLVPEALYYTFKQTANSTGQVTFNLVNNSNTNLFNTIISATATTYFTTNTPTQAPVCSIQSINNPFITVNVFDFPKLTFGNFGKYYPPETRGTVEIFINVVGVPIISNLNGSVYYGTNVIPNPKYYTFSALTQNGRAMFYLTDNNTNTGANLFNTIYSVSTSAVRNTASSTRTILTSVNSINNPEISVNVFLIPTIVADNFGQFLPEIAPDNIEIQIIVIAS